ncbi:MAG: hypothetical protein ACI9LY_002622 [Arenicella sp.]|jgi:hypothetical protein
MGNFGAEPQNESREYEQMFDELAMRGIVRGDTTDVAKTSEVNGVAVPTADNCGDSVDSEEGRT